MFGVHVEAELARCITPRTKQHEVVAKKTQRLRELLADDKPDARPEPGRFRDPAGMFKK